MEVLSFFIDHIYSIITIILSIIVLFITIFKKKTVINDSLTDVLLLLPELIREAEESGVSGVDKFSYVFNVAINELCALTGEDSKKVLCKYSALLNHAIESILSTPEKKKEIL